MIQPLIDADGIYRSNYRIDPDGTVSSIDRLEVFFSKRHGNVEGRMRKGKKLSQTLNNTGYLTVALYLNGKCKRVGVHRLVAIQHIPNPNNLPEVNHKDGNRLNNSVNNLEWVDRKQNAIHSTTVLKKNIGEENAASLLSPESVIEICALLDSGKSQTEISRLFSVTNSCIYRIHHGHNWNHLTARRKEGVNDSTTH